MSEEPCSSTSIPKKSRKRNQDKAAADGGNIMSRYIQPNEDVSQRISERCLEIATLRVKDFGLEMEKDGLNLLAGFIRKLSESIIKEADGVAVHCGRTEITESDVNWAVNAIRPARTLVDRARLAEVNKKEHPKFREDSFFHYPPERFCHLQPHYEVNIAVQQFPVVDDSQKDNADKTSNLNAEQIVAGLRSEDDDYD